MTTELTVSCTFWASFIVRVLHWQLLNCKWWRHWQLAYDFIVKDIYWHWSNLTSVVATHCLLWIGTFRINCSIRLPHGRVIFVCTITPIIKSKPFLIKDALVSTIELLTLTQHVNFVGFIQLWAMIIPRNIGIKHNNVIKGQRIALSKVLILVNERIIIPISKNLIKHHLLELELIQKDDEATDEHKVLNKWINRLQAKEAPLLLTSSSLVQLSCQFLSIGLILITLITWSVKLVAFNVLDLLSFKVLNFLKVSNVVVSGSDVKLIIYGFCSSIWCLWSWSSAKHLEFISFLVAIVLR